jgi:hypothetical protein
MGRLLHPEALADPFEPESLRLDGVFRLDGKDHLASRSGHVVDFEASGE